MFKGRQMCLPLNIRDAEAQNWLAACAGMTGGRRTCELALCFSHGEGVNWSLVFDVFAFKIRADPFTPVGAGGGEKFNLFEPRAGTLAWAYF